MKNENRFKLLPFFLILVLFILGYIFTNPFRTKKLTEQEKNSIPYKGNEVLVFKSNKSELDTIRITKINIQTHPPNLGDIFWAKNTEVLRVHYDINCKNCDAIITYEVQNFSSKTNIYYDLKINEKKYYHGTNFKTFKKLKTRTVKVNGTVYDDVILIERKEKIKKLNARLDSIFYQNMYAIDKLYCSKSKGFVRFEINPNEYWELIAE